MEQLQSESSNNTSANKQLELKVLREHIKAAEKQLASLKETIPKTEDKIKSLQSDLVNLGKKKLDVLKDIERIEKQRDLNIQKAAQDKDSINFDIRQLNAELKERNTYLKEQEEVISETIERGNEQLKIIRYEVEEFEQVKQELENDIFDSKQILEQLGHEVSQAATQLGSLQEAYKQEEAILEDELTKIRAEIGDAKLENQAIEKDTEHKLSILKVKEEGIIAREEAIRLKTDDITRRERRLNTSERLYA